MRTLTEIASAPESGPAPRKGDALYRAWRTRIDRYLDQAFQTMSKEDRVALSAPDDFWTFFRTLASSPARSSQC